MYTFIFLIPSIICFHFDFLIKHICSLSYCNNLFIYDVQVIRENQVVVVVGETGSGKTTQLTQVCCCFLCFILLNYVIQSRKEKNRLKALVICYK
jgi:ABC-type cobalamin/Fe3+-siderophores transport system ATPase subunit